MKTEREFFSHICCKILNKYYSKRDDLEYECTMSIVIKMMDDAKISWINQNILLDYYNNWEDNYKTILSCQVRDIFNDDIKPNLLKLTIEKEA